MTTLPTDRAVRCQPQAACKLGQNAVTIVSPSLSPWYHSSAKLFEPTVSLPPEKQSSIMGLLPAAEDKEGKAINLIWGKPAPSLLPVDEMAAAAQKVFANPDIARAAMQYGDSPRAGYQPLRQRLSAFLSEFYGSPGDPNQICITGGASQGLTVLLQMLSDPIATKAVWITAPCFFAARKIFEDAGFAGKLRGVNELDDGSIDLAYLEREMAKLDREASVNKICKPATITQKTYTHLIFTVPTFSNPSGKTMPLACREGLISLARAHDALIISDDVYDMLQWSSTGNKLTSTSPLPRLVDIDRALPIHATDPRGFRHSVSNGSFSKIVAPGVRTGWIDAAPAIVEALAECGATISGGCPSQLVAAMLAELMGHGWLERHIRERLVPAYMNRRMLLMDAVERELGRLGGGVADVRHVGGFFVWVRLPSRVRATDVAAMAREDENLIVAPGPLFGVTWDEQEMDLDGFLRLSFSHEDESNLVEGVRRLGKVTERILNKCVRTASSSGV